MEKRSQRRREEKRRQLREREINKGYKQLSRQCVSLSLTHTFLALYSFLFA